MSAWIESHQSLATHRKTMILETALNIETPQAIGHLHLLWWWCVDNSPDGVLTGIPNKVISKASLWTGNPDLFVESLILAGFIDKEPKKIHDWDDFAGRLIDRRNDNKLRMKQYRAAHVHNTCDPHSAITVPNRTIQNRTEQSNKNLNKKKMPANLAKLARNKNNTTDYSKMVVT